MVGIWWSFVFAQPCKVPVGSDRVRHASETCIEDTRFRGFASLASDHGVLLLSWLEAGSRLETWVSVEDRQVVMGQLFELACEQRIRASCLAWSSVMKIPDLLWSHGNKTIRGPAGPDHGVERTSNGQRGCL